MLSGRSATVTEAPAADPFGNRQAIALPSSSRTGPIPSAATASWLVPAIRFAAPMNAATKALAGRK